MPKATAGQVNKRYRALRGVAVRKSDDPKSPAWQQFHEWEAGEELTDAPAYTDLKGLLEVGAIEEVTDG